MERRKSIVNVFPIQFEPKPKIEEKHRRKSTVTRPVEDISHREKRPNSAERHKEPSELGPPVRRVSTAVTPLAHLQEVAKQRNGFRQSTSGSAALPDKYRRKSSVIPPRILEGEEFDKKESGSRGKKEFNKYDLRDVLDKIKNYDGESNETMPNANEENAKKLHLSLRKSYENKETYKMTFRTRQKGDSVRSRDSGVGAFDDDESVVEFWKQRWNKNQVGSGQGEIKSIKGICFTFDDNVAVAEEKNSRIQIFDRKTGNSIRILQEGNSVGQIKPAGICQLSDNNFLAIADRDRIVYMEPTSKGASDSKILEKQVSLHGIAVNSRDKLIVTDTYKKNASLYEIDGRRILKFKPTDFQTPNYVAVSDEYSLVFVSDSEQGCVYVLNMDGEVLQKIGKEGDDNERLIYPMGVCCLPNGKLIVSDRGQHRLLTYDFRARSMEHLLTKEDLLKNPTCIASDGSKYLVIAEENHDYKIDEYGLKMFSKYKLTH